jgi:NAD(P)-dependent dehydrogenase (short-subunit alcohol dehydrogenase family)
VLNNPSDSLGLTTHTINKNIMPIITSTTATITAIFGASAFVLRRRISRSWIDLRHKQYDLNGKTIIITGGNIGLGYEVAKDLAKRNGNIILACRDTMKGQKAATSISKATGNSNVSYLEVDLASLASVKNFVTEVQSKHDKIDVLICNAGVWVPMEQKMKTSDGYEIHFGVNHLSHLLIAKELVPQLEKSSDGRIVFVSSSLMKNGKIDMSSALYDGRVDKDQNGLPKKSFMPTGYCDSKLMNALTCKHMASILPPTVSTYSVCPGFCRSSLGRNVVMPLHKKLMVGPIMWMVQRTAVQGAQNICFTALESKEKLKSGNIYRDGEVMKDHMDHMDNVGGNTEAKKLWELSEELLNGKKKN